MDIRAHGLVVFGIGFSLWTAVQSMRRLRAMTSTPLSRIRSAAQGFVELTGQVRAFETQVLRAPVSGRDCVAYELLVERREGREWKVKRRESVRLPFLVDDGTGECLVMPEGARIEHFPAHRAFGREDAPGFAGPWRFMGFQSWRFTETIVPLDRPVYLLGHFEGYTPPSHGSLLRERLGELKRDQAGLRARFDADGDGRVSPEEWEAARAAVSHEVSAELLAARRAGGHAILRRPEHATQPFLISAETDERRLTRGLRRMSIAAWLGFFTLLGFYVFNAARL